MMAVWPPGSQGRGPRGTGGSLAIARAWSAGWRGRSGPARRSEQRLAHPALLWLTGKAVLETVQAAGERVLGGWLAVGLDITFVHSHGRRTRKSGLVGRHLVADQGGAQLGVDAEFSSDSLHQPQRSPIVRAPLDIQHLNHRAPSWTLPGDRRQVGLPALIGLRMGPGHGAGMRQQAATWSALRSSNPSASSSMSATRWSARR